MTLIYLTLKHAFNDIVIVNLENDFNLPNSQTKSSIGVKQVALENDFNLPNSQTKSDLLFYFKCLRMTLIYLTLKL